MSVEQKYAGALRSTFTKSGEVAVIFTRSQAKAYLIGQSDAGAQVRVDLAIAQAIEAVLPSEEADDGL